VEVKGMKKCLKLTETQHKNVKIEPNQIVDTQLTNSALNHTSSKCLAVLWRFKTPEERVIRR
jgi:hypothetical protein